MPAIELSEIQISKSLLLNDQEKVCEMLKKYGVLSVRNMYEGDIVKKLNAEFNSLLTSTASFVRSVDYSEGKAVVVQMDKLDAAEFSTTASVFRAPYFESLTSAYLNDSGVHANRMVYVVNDVVGSRHHANDLHFDVQRSLKFFVYLTDTTIENGAFSCVPGSNNITRDIRLREGRNISYEKRELSRQLPVNESDAIALEGEAGSLIIFDTDVFHRAGFVSKGERRVMRGQSNFSDKLNYPGERGKGKSFFSKLFG